MFGVTLTAILGGCFVVPFCCLPMSCVVAGIAGIFNQ